MISECVIEIITQKEIAIYYKSLSVGNLWSRLLWCYCSFVNTSVMVQVGDYRPVFHLPFDFCF